VLGVGQDERGPGDAADLAGTGGDVLEGAPAAGEHGEPAFAQAAQRALDGVARAGVDVEFPAAAGLLDGNQDADAGAFIAGIGQSGQAGGGGVVERGQCMGARGGDVVRLFAKIKPGCPNLFR
jgi:hypothetical protein